MSSLFHVTEQALATLCLDALEQWSNAASWSVAVGGLGLGYTAVAALGHPRVESLDIIELFEAVIDWHQQGLVPLGAQLSGDSRVRLIQADFFKRIAAPLPGLDGTSPARRYDALLVDIDHSPDFPLDQRNSPFYEVDGLARVLPHLQPGGVFGLWSDADPQASFEAAFGAVFDSAHTEVVGFDNPYTGGESTGTIYFGFAPATPAGHET